MNSMVLAAGLTCVLVLGEVSTPAQAGPSSVVSGPLVVSGSWPECTDLVTWTRDVMRLEGLEDASETARAKAFFRWLRLFNRMATGGMIQAFEGRFGEEGYVTDCHKNLFVYGWGYCDTHSRIADAAWSEYTGDPSKAERVVTQHEDGGYHTMYRLELDGHWGAFDARYGYYLIERDDPDARILDWAEVGVDQNIHGNKGFKHRSQPFFEYFGREWDRALLVSPVYYESERAWRAAGAPIECVFGNSHYRAGTRYHDMSFALPKGTTIERFWDNRANKVYVPGKRDIEEPFLPSGRFYRVTETMLDGNWVKHDPNYEKCAAYLTTVPADQGYRKEIAGGRTIGQACGRLIYEPDLADPGLLDVSALETDLRHDTSAPHLRPARLREGGQAVFDFYSPYVLVSASLRGEWIASAGDDARVEMRTLAPKRQHEDVPDEWSPWRTIASGSPVFEVELDRQSAARGEASVHGVYRFQIRLSLGQNAERPRPVGLKSLRLEAWFENGIMSIPRIARGENTVHFKVRDASAVRGPIEVTYAYQTNEGERRHVRVLKPEDFRGNTATYRFEAPGLTRCNSLRVRY